MGRDGCPKGPQCIYLHQRACPTVENSSLCENRNCLFIHKEISKLTNPPMPSSTGYWDGTQWKIHKPKKGVTTWTGVGNPNQSITQINQTQSNWSNWYGVENTNNGVQMSQTQQKGFGTGMPIQTETQPTAYPTAPVYYQGTQPGYRQVLQPTYSQVTQPTYSQTFPTMMPGAGLIMSQQGSGNGSQIGQNLNGSLMGQSLNGSYMFSQIPHNQTQAQGVAHTQSQQTLAPQGTQQVQNAPQQSQGTQQPQTITQHNQMHGQFQTQLGQPGIGQTMIPTTTC